MLRRTHATLQESAFNVILFAVSGGYDGGDNFVAAAAIVVLLFLD